MTIIYFSARTAQPDTMHIALLRCDEESARAHGQLQPRPPVPIPTLRIISPNNHPLEELQQRGLSSVQSCEEIHQPK
jgi:hypothetical protein